MEELTRLQIVKQFKNLNIRYNQQLQYMVSFAAKIFKTPIASITLIDKDTQWVKISKGLNFEQSPRALSFCTHAIKRKSVFIVHDTLQDARFNKSPYVVDGLKIRFYAGAPLITQGGHRIGTLCVMDKKPRTPTEQQKLVLKVLAQSAISVMELKLSLDQLDQGLTDLKEVRKNMSQNEIKLRAMFESLADEYFLLGKNGEILDFNHLAYQAIKDIYDIKLSAGRTMTGFLAPDYRELFSYNYHRALKGEEMQLERLTDLGDKGKIWFDCRFEPVRNDMNEIIGVSYLTRNINERKLNELKVVQQNSSLLKIAEIQSHDYRGPVATILGVMNLIEADHYLASKEYLMMLHTATTNLDGKIHEVVELVNSAGVP